MTKKEIKALYNSQRKAIHNYQKKIPNIKQCKIELIEVTEDKAREDYWIKYYRNLGFDL